MLGLGTLDILIGLVTLYLTFGLACTAIVEAISAWFGIRAKTLEEALTKLLPGSVGEAQKTVDAFYAHPLVASLSKSDKDRPSYIPASVVGQVAESLILAKAGVNALSDATGKGLLDGSIGSFARQCAGDASAFRTAVEEHFNAAMDRANGWYKRYTQTVALVAAAVLVIGANLDTLQVVRTLQISPDARARLVETASNALKSAASVPVDATKMAGATNGGGTIEQTRKAREAMDRAFQQMQSSALIFGWSQVPEPSQLPAKIVGLLISIFAVSLGAPFWFDILQRFMKVRATGGVEGSGKAPRK